MPKRGMKRLGRENKINEAAAVAVVEKPAVEDGQVVDERRLRVGAVVVVERSNSVLDAKLY